MEREHAAPIHPLVEVAKQDFPQASEVLVSFRDQWEYINVVRHAGGRIYVAGFPIERSLTGREHFEGLPAEINVDLVFYRLYKFFEPAPIPQVRVAWDETKGEGRVVGFQGFQLQLQPIGQAQAWFGLTHAVLWECYLEPSHRFPHWQDTLAELWTLVEHDVQAPHLFTAPHDPAFQKGYRNFLTRQGYAQNTEHPLWWSKNRTAASEQEIKSRVSIREEE